MTRFCEFGGSCFLTALNIKKYDLIDIFNFDIKNDILVISNYHTVEEIIKIQELLSNGAKFVYNNLWEGNWTEKKDFNLMLGFENQGIIFNGYFPRKEKKETSKSYYVPMFFWYTESLKSRKYKIVKRNNKIKFLMKMNNVKEYRNLLFEKIKNHLDDSIFSYRALGYYLLNDNMPFNDRFINEIWYQDTCFSLVVETDYENDLVFLTEKTFKPISIGHPFIIFGNPYSLKLLKENGFKTFDILFDESYDEIESTKDRLDMILNQVINFNKENDCYIDDIIEYNYNLFYDSNLVQRRILDEIITPLENFINA